MQVETLQPPLCTHPEIEFLAAFFSERVGHMPEILLNIGEYLPFTSLLRDEFDALFLISLIDYGPEGRRYQTGLEWGCCSYLFMMLHGRVDEASGERHDKKILLVCLVFIFHSALACFHRLLVAWLCFLFCFLTPCLCVLRGM